jgi:surface antigen
LYQSKHIKVSVTAQHQKASNVELKVKKNAALGVTLLGTGVLAGGLTTTVSADDTTAAVKTADQVNQAALLTIRGNLGNGEARIQNLTASGYDAGAVQSRVNELYANPSLIENQTTAAPSSGTTPAAAVPTNSPAAKTADQINQEALQVIRGDLGNGDARVQNLVAAGFDPTAVQNRVNELLYGTPQTPAATIQAPAASADISSTSIPAGWDVSGPLPSNSFANDPYPWGQCTWYVYGRAAQLGISFSTQMGNAGDWMYAAGYTVTQTPTKHAALSFLPGQAGADATYGHVAFVEDVKADGSILISESNAQGLGVVSYRTFSAEEAKQFHYVIGQTQVAPQAASQSAPQVAPQSDKPVEPVQVTSLAQKVRYIK